MITRFFYKKKSDFTMGPSGLLLPFFSAKIIIEIINNSLLNTGYFNHKDPAFRRF